MEPAQFLAQLDGMVAEKLERIGAASRSAEPKETIGVRELLITALKKELEATEEAAMWIATEMDGCLLVPAAAPAEEGQA